MGSGDVKMRHRVSVIVGIRDFPPEFVIHVPPKIRDSLRGSFPLRAGQNQH